MSPVAPPSPATDDERRDELLRAAFGAFVRFGYRKTSMDEIARAAGLSRQGLYLHFRSKEELFREMVGHLLGRALLAAASVLGDDALPVRERLVRGFDEWAGWYVEAAHGPGMGELLEASAALVQPVVDDHEARFDRALVKAIRGSGLAAAHERSGLGARQLARTLQAVARGLKVMAASRPAFVEGIDHAVRALCTPLDPAVAPDAPAGGKR